MTTIELFAKMLNYPDAQLSLVFERLSERLSDECPEAVSDLRSYGGMVKELSLTSQCELYTRTFDLMAVCSPYAGIHLYGEDNYKRGGLMARLKEVFSLNGLEIGNELPDHVTVLLQYCAIAPVDEAQEVREYLLRPVVESMVTILSKTQNPYVHLLLSLSSVMNSQILSFRNDHAGVNIL